MKNEPRKSTKEIKLRSERPAPYGYQTLFDAIEDVGHALYPKVWTGNERRYIGRPQARINDQPIIRSSLEYSLRKTISDEAIELSKSNSKYQNSKKVINTGELLFYPTKEAYAVVHNESEIIRNLAAQVKALITRRDDVETACFNALWSADSSTEPECRACSWLQDGSTKSIAAHWWGSHQGKNTLKCEYPGYHDHNLVLIPNGNLAEAVRRMDGDKSGVKRVKESPKTQTVLRIITKLFPNGDSGTLTVDEIVSKIIPELAENEAVSDATMRKAIQSWKKQQK